MKFNAQALIDDLDKTTVLGFAEALLVAMASIRDKQGFVMAIRMSDSPEENIRYAKEIALMMLGEKQ